MKTVKTTTTVRIVNTIGLTETVKTAKVEQLPESTYPPKNKLYF